MLLKTLFHHAKIYYLCTVFQTKWLMKSNKNIRTMVQNKLHNIRPLRALVMLCTAVVLIAAIYAIIGTVCTQTNKGAITRKLYGEEIGDRGLRYKYGDHIYDPKTGKILLDSISWLHTGRGDSIGIVAKHNKRAYINLNTARLLTPLEYDKAWVFGSDRGVMVKKDTIYIFRRDGSTVNSHGLRYYGQYDLVYYKGKLTVISDNNLYGVLDTAANWVLPQQYTYIDNDYQHQLYNTKKGEQCIVYDYNLNTVLSGNYSRVDIDWTEGIIATEYNGVQHLFDYKGKMIYQTIYKTICKITYNTHQKDKQGTDIYADTDCYMYVDYNNKCGLMDKQYRVLTPPLFNDINAQSKHIFFATFGDYSDHFGTLIDDHGKPIR